MPRRALASCAGLLLAAAPLAAAPNHDRGEILNLDTSRMEIEIKDTKDRPVIWKVAKDATIKFTDQAWPNRSPRFQDLKKGMYVHFMYDSESKVVQEIDVKDIGSVNKNQPPPSSGGSSGSEGRTYEGDVTAVDLNVAQVAVRLSRGAEPRPFQAANANVLRGIEPGDRVTLITENRNGQDVIVEVKRTGSRRR
jgi:hypothetical protein